MIEELLIELLPTQEARHTKAGNAAAVQANNAIEEANREVYELKKKQNWGNHYSMSERISKAEKTRDKAIVNYLQLINE
jgi:hypothetical protein